MARRVAQGGYVLIYALSILLFLAGTVTGAAYGLRVDAQEVMQQRERLRAEFRLRGALQYALAQFALGRPGAAAGPAAATSPAAAAAPAAAAGPAAGQAERRDRGWQLEAATREVQIDGEDVAVAIDDPGGIADANALDERMWTDYFSFIAAVPQEQARHWAAAVMAWKARAGNANGRNAFGGIDDLLALDALPVAVRYGEWAGMQEPTASRDTMPGLPDLFMVGNGDVALDINRGALPLVAAITGAGAERVAAFGAARSQRKLTAEDATRLLGPRAAQFMLDGRADVVMRLSLTTTTGANRLALVAFLRRQDNDVRVLAIRLRSMAAAAAEP